MVGLAWAPRDPLYQLLILAANMFALIGEGSDNQRGLMQSFSFELSMKMHVFARRVSFPRAVSRPGFGYIHPSFGDAPSNFF